MNRRHFLKATGLTGSAALLAGETDAQGSRAVRIELRRSTVVVRPGDLPNAERTAAEMLVDEVASRCGLRLPISTGWPASGPVIAITSERQVPGWRHPIPVRPGGAETRAEGYRLFVDQGGASPTIWIAGADARGALFGAGRLLRELDWARGNTVHLTTFS